MDERNEQYRSQGQHIQGGISPSRRTRAAAQQSQAAPRSGVSGVWLKVLIPIAVVMVAAVIVLAVGFTYANRVSQLTTIYPNVSVNGVYVGGMTMGEAAAALGDDPGRYDNAAVTVNFPTGESVTVTAQQLGLKPSDGTDLARAAYSYGRGGSMLSNLMAYRTCKTEPVDMAVDQAETVIDDQIIAGLVQPVAEEVDAKLRVTNVQISPEQISVKKNSGTTCVDTAAVTEMIQTAFEAEDYGTIDYEMPAAGTVEGSQDQARDVDEFLQLIYDKVYVEPADAYFDEAANTVVDAVTGVSFDKDQAAQLWNEAAEGETVTIPLVFDEPEVTAEQVRATLFADVLAEKSTSLAGSTSARINNITLAAASMNGVVLQPGEEFDYNACLGQRTEAKGYQSAGAFSNGEHGATSSWWPTCPGAWTPRSAGAGRTSSSSTPGPTPSRSRPGWRTVI